MENWFKRYENVMTAAAFAEAGEYSTAREIVNEIRPEKRPFMRKFERLMLAVTFAEAGEHDTAREIMRKDKRPQKRDYVRQRPRAQLRAPGIDR